ncbi:phage head closure protein [Globicatella sp. PHS-GS-PNBC-21-1553]|uniref:phage head closure protein n=1 Tax=Globicatella sp. PHS-GS-PNBC-21-1553 TaxID=2885764 RepID=UPI00298F031C|nr:phage head closure protein [Globicatella sp. PHS-GS-PNBC-21-1553]WPC09812.1 phage head closure protein [Globicatella sp. PHS-GS-PNBC-21-1553]
MNWNHIVTLLSISITADEYGNQIEESTATNVLCKKKSITRQEFYQASVTDYKPALILIVHTFEYSGQEYIEFGGVRYRVIRTFESSFEETELVCEVIMGGY